MENKITSFDKVEDLKFLGCGKTEYKYEGPEVGLLERRQLRKQAKAERQAKNFNRKED